jgi:hypothetical protein
MSQSQAGLSFDPSPATEQLSSFRQVGKTVGVGVLGEQGRNGPVSNPQVSALGAR